MWVDCHVEAHVVVPSTCGSVFKVKRIFFETPTNISINSSRVSTRWISTVTEK